MCGEPHLPRLKLVCVNPWIFSRLPVTLYIGNTATERRSGFIQRTPKCWRGKAALMPRDTGTECANGSRMKTKGKGVCVTFCYFTGRKYTLSLSCTHAGALMLLLLQMTSTTSSAPTLGFQYLVWFLARFSFIPAPAGFDPSYSGRLFPGFCPLQKYFKRSCSVRWECLNVELLLPRSSVHLCLHWLWFRPAKFLCLCKDHGQLLQGGFLQNPGTPPQVCDIWWLWRRLTSCVAAIPDLILTQRRRSIWIEQLEDTNIQWPILSERQRFSPPWHCPLQLAREIMPWSVRFHVFKSS